MKFKLMIAGLLALGMSAQAKDDKYQTFQVI